MIARFRLWIRHIYLQGQHWGRSNHSVRDLLIITLLSSVIIPIPIEIFLITIITAAPQRWLRAAISATMGSVLGGLIWYLAGKMLLGNFIAWAQIISPTANWEEIKMAISSDGVGFLIFAAFTPGLFRVGTTAAGVVGFNPMLFILSVAFSRGLRFILEAGLLRIFGKKFSSFLEKYFDLLSLGMGAVAFIFFIAIRLMKN